MRDRRREPDSLRTLATITSLVGYGTPDEQMRQCLDPFGAFYMTPFDGFAR